MNKLLILILIFLFPFAALRAQTKHEREFRIKSNTVPKRALLFIDSLYFNKRIKWYKEVDIDKTSIEAKQGITGKSIV